MREIKFRAYDIYSNDVVSIKTIDFEADGSVGCVVDFDGINLDVSECVLMQYTGLKDKTHLKDIVFGDVVIVDSPKGPFKAKITQEVGAFGIVAIDGQIIDYFEDNWNDDFMALLDIYWNFNNDDNVIEEIEVIGNIYENPELLEVQNG